MRGFVKCFWVRKVAENSANNTSGRERVGGWVGVGEERENVTFTFLKGFNQLGPCIIKTISEIC